MFFLPLWKLYVSILNLFARLFMFYMVTLGLQKTGLISAGKKK